MISGLSQSEAEHIAATEPMKLELFYDVELGSFAIDAEAVGNTPLYHPYTGNEIPMKRHSKHNLFTRGGERKFSAFFILQLL